MTRKRPSLRAMTIAALSAAAAFAIGAVSVRTFAADAPPAGSPAAAADNKANTVDGGLIGQPHEWSVHDRSRPQPPVITPPTPSTQEQAGQAPSDAIVLFDGKDLSAWKADKGGGEPKWKVENGYFEIVKGSGGISTKQQFGDIQLHAEFRMPDPPVGRDQDRGNSGIFLMGKFEMQVLDNYKADTYADGMVGSVYGQYPPQVNAARPPGQWQWYDVVFHGPVFGDDGKLIKPATVTSFLNGVLVQDHVELKGPTQHMNLTSYKNKFGPTGPISLQDHGHPVRYRNIWVRPITTAVPVAPVKPGEKH